MEKGTSSELPVKETTIADLKSLCLALLDNLNDKNIALTHQKKTNKYLMHGLSFSRFSIIYF